jgi:ATP-binding protein involved in chromosome partitioning
MALWHQADVPRRIKTGLKPLKNVTNVIAVASGKGGVGKTTTAVNLAVTLAKKGLRVAVLDADVYGPNGPAMLGLEGMQLDAASLPYTPPKAHGVHVMSMAFLMDADAPLVWRGPMASRAVQQLACDTAWPELDVLLLDLPPGTGDIPLTIAQKLPVAGAVIVTTPQHVALLDAQKGLAMFHKLGITVLGVIENMAEHVCEACGHRSPVFDQGGGTRLAQKHELPLLGAMPLHRVVCEAGDAGVPVVLGDTVLAKAYLQAAEAMMQQLALQPKSYASVFPPIVVEPKQD